MEKKNSSFGASDFFIVKIGDELLPFVRVAGNSFSVESLYVRSLSSSCDRVNDDGRFPDVML